MKKFLRVNHNPYQMSWHLKFKALKNFSIIIIAIISHEYQLLKIEKKIARRYLIQCGFSIFCSLSVQNAYPKNST